MTAPPSIKYNEVADHLDTAATIVTKNGHHKGSLYAKQRGRHRRYSPVCAAGAINMAVHGSPLVPDMYATRPGEPDVYGWDYAMAGSAIRAVQGHLRVWNLGEWNDEPVRSAAQVVQALRETAARLRDPKSAPCPNSPKETRA